MDRLLGYGLGGLGLLVVGASVLGQVVALVGGRFVAAMGLTASIIGGAILYRAGFCMANRLTGTGADEAGSPVYDRRMTRQVRIVLWILAALLLPILVTPVLGFYPPLLLLYYGWPLVLLAMAWGILDATYHRDSVWREADQNKIVWVLVQFIPLVGTMAYYILVHPTVMEAENRVRRS